MPRTRLPAAPADLPIGSLVEIARPINPGIWNPVGRRGRVARTSLYQPQPRWASDPANPPKLEPPRLFVVIRMNEPMYKLEETYKWSDELDLLTEE